jgi:hypothetical protein
MERKSLTRSLTACVFLLLASIVLVHAVLRIEGFQRYQQFLRPLAPSADVAEASRIMVDPDSYFWILHAEAAAEHRFQKIARHTDWDNAPDGRDLYWSSPFVYWLNGLALFFDSPQTSHRDALEQAGWWSGPILMVLGLALFCLLTARAHSHQLACLMAAGVVASPQLVWTFFPGRPDHHALISWFSLFFMLCMVKGQSSAAFAWKLAAALSGIGLFWVSAVTGMVVLAVTLGAFFLSRLFCSTEREGLQSSARSWLGWGLIGAGGILIVQLFENGITLESPPEFIHPLHAIFWLSSAGLLYGLSRDRFSAAVLRPWFWVTSLVLISSAGCWVWLMLSTNALFDIRMQRLHQFIDEFRPYAAAVGDGALWTFFQDFGALLGVPIILFSVLFSSSVPASIRSRSFMGLTMILAMFALSMMQYRWSSLLSCAMAAAAIALPQRSAGSPSREQYGWTLFYVLLTGFGLYFASSELKLSHAIAKGHEVPRSLIDETITRDVARFVRMHEQGSLRVMTNPAKTPALAYHGGMQGAGSLYWENGAGLDKTIAVMLATDFDAACAQLQAWNYTHIVWFTKPSYLAELMMIRDGVASAEDLRNTFGYHLLSGSAALPAALEEIRYGLPFRAFDGFPGGVRIFRIRPAE